VHADHIQRIVVAESEFRPNRERANDACRQPDDGSAEGVHRSTGRGDRDQAGDNTRGGTKGSRLAVANPLD
jgi:hypothetical protein